MAVRSLCRLSWFVAFLSMFIGGCATTPGPTAVDDPQRAWQQREQRLLALQDWAAVGRLSIKSERHSGRVTVRWTQHGDTYRIRLSGPLGQGIADLNGGPDRVVMRTSKNETFVAKDAEQLLVDTLGLRIPVSGLRYWIMGGSEPGKPITTLALDVAGDPDELHQSGWQVRYLRYEPFGDLRLPTKLFLENDTVSARIVVSRWTLGSA